MLYFFQEAKVGGKASLERREPAGEKLQEHRRCRRVSAAGGRLQRAEGPQQQPERQEDHTAQQRHLPGPLQRNTDVADGIIRLESCLKERKIR